MTRYSFSLLRFAPDPVSGEFATFGVVMWVPDERRILFSLPHRYRRLKDFFASFDQQTFQTMRAQLERRLVDLQRVVSEPQGDLGLTGPKASSLVDLLAVVLPERSPTLTASHVMGGLSEEPEARLDELAEEFILRHYRAAGHEGRTSQDVRRTVEDRLSVAGLGESVQRDITISTRHRSHVFPFGWMNGHQQVAEPLSLDLTTPEGILSKVDRWSGLVVHLRREAKEPVDFTAIVAAPSDPTRRLREVFQKGVAQLNDLDEVREVVLEADVENFVRQVRDDLDHVE